MRLQVWAWECELCGHRWLAVGIEAPAKCAKCKRRNWHTKAVQSVSIEPDPEPETTAPSQDRESSPRLSDFISIPDPEPVKMCSHVEYDGETGEWYGCRMPEHSNKVKCQRGQKVDGP